MPSCRPRLQPFRLQAPVLKWQRMHCHPPLPACLSACSLSSPIRRYTSLTTQLTVNGKSHREATPEAAAQAVAQHPGAKFIAGGTNLLDLMKLQVETPVHLVDVNRLGLDRIEDTAEGGLRIGAMVRNSDLAADLRMRRRYPVLARVPCSRVLRASCATRPRLAATCCSARAATIFMTPASRATSASRARAARLLGASTACMRCWVPATSA